MRECPWGHPASPSIAHPQEPYLESVCECCSYRLDPASPVRVLRLPCPGGTHEPAVLPRIHSCHCAGCRGAWVRVGVGVREGVRVGQYPGMQHLGH